jgi:hypothetical protein
MSSVVELRPGSLTALIYHWGPTTVDILKMLESGVSEQPHALREPSDCKEALPPKGVWRSATIMSGAQCVMISLVLLMLKWPADSWDSLPQVHMQACTAF